MSNPAGQPKSFETPFDQHFGPTSCRAQSKPNSMVFGRRRAELLFLSTEIRVRHDLIYIALQAIIRRCSKRNATLFHNKMKSRVREVGVVQHCILLCAFVLIYPQFATEFLGIAMLRVRCHHPIEESKFVINQIAAAGSSFSYTNLSFGSESSLTASKDVRRESPACFLSVASSPRKRRMLSPSSTY
jgi:hypothetical protein